MDLIHCEKNAHVTEADGRDLSEFIINAVGIEGL